MEIQSHIFDELRIVFSRKRLDSYLNHANCQNDKKKTLIAYSWNIELSLSLYPSLQTLEIALRNALHTAISEYYKTEHWFDLPFLHTNEIKDILQAKNKLKNARKPMEPSRLVAELSFGFWTALFDVRYEHEQVLWPKLLKQTFPFLPKGQRTRTFLSRELNRIRFLRNRIFHYEPIWHWNDLIDKHNSIINIIHGLSHSASIFLHACDHFKEVYYYGKLQIENNIEKLIHNQQSIKSSLTT